MDSVFCKILVVGCQGVGKTSIVNKQCYDIWQSDAMATIGAEYSIKRINDPKTKKNFHLQFWDIAGDERFANMCKLYVRGSHMCLVVTDSITCSKKLSRTQQWRDIIESYSEELQLNKPGFLLVVSKKDITKNELSFDEIKRLKQTMKFDDVIEVSALSSDGMNEQTSKITSEHVKNINKYDLNQSGDSNDGERISKRISILEEDEIYHCCPKTKKKKKKCKNCQIF